MKNYLKTLFRTLKRQAARLISLIFIILVSVGFVSGILSSTDQLGYTLTDYYNSNEVADYIAKSKTGTFTKEQISAVKEYFGEENVAEGLSVDYSVGEKRSVRLYFLDFSDLKVNLPDVVEGEAPSENSKTVAYAERADNVIEGYAVGDEVEIDLKEALSLPIPYKLKVEIKGILQSPLTFARDGEPSYNNDEDAEIPEDNTALGKMDLLENVLYLSKDALPIPVTGDLYIKGTNRTAFDDFSSEYQKHVDGEAAYLETELLGEDVATVLTLYENYSFKSYHAYAEKVFGIGIVLMIAFLAVTVLVVVSTMTRLIEEERSQIACLRTLGFSAFHIVSKYIIFAMLAMGIGGVGAYFVGTGLSYLICVVFDYSYAMPAISMKGTLAFFFLAYFVIVGVTLLATMFAGLKTAREQPADLLRPKPPKSGKKVILERIPLIWNRLSFKYKSTMRNVLRYKNRFFMTVVAVAVSMALVLAGLALLDLCLFDDFGSASVMAIAFVVLFFAGLLTAVVIYTLTNINVSERNREIATLMVLGYQDGEVTGYIYREVYINTAVGIVLGYPLGVLLMLLVFTVMGFGTVGGMSWFMWLIAPVVVFAFTGLVTLLLRRKILKISMNESLKAIE